MNYDHHVSDLVDVNIHSCFNRSCRFMASGSTTGEVFAREGTGEEKRQSLEAKLMERFEYFSETNGFQSKTIEQITWQMGKTCCTKTQTSIKDCWEKAHVPKWCWEPTWNPHTNDEAQEELAECRQLWLLDWKFIIEKFHPWSTVLFKITLITLSLYIIGIYIPVEISTMFWQDLGSL